MKTEKPILIGLTGRKRAGKDSVAAAIERNYGSNRVLTTSFAKPIRDFVAHLMGVSRSQLEKLKDSDYTIPGTNVGFSPRYAMQTLGTEWGRALHPDLWVAACERWIDDISSDGTRNAEFILVTDVRFDNEAEMIHRKGGVVVKIERDECGPEDGHASERGVSGKMVDIHFHNDGSLADLGNRVACELMPSVLALKNFDDIRHGLCTWIATHDGCYFNPWSTRLAA
jgi:hypothetical protein